MGSGPTELTARGLRRLAQARSPRRWLASSRAPKLSSSRISMERLKAALGAVAIVAAVAWAPWASRADCPPDNAGLTLPAGFCATVFADNLGHPRHIAVAPNGIVYVNTWSGRYYGNDQPPAGGFLVALRDTTGDGRADLIVRFGDSVQSGGPGRGGGIGGSDANRPGQRFSPAGRYATGIRNAGGIAVDASGSGVYSTQHGRDQLAENWPSLYQPQQGANLPAEELLRIERGADYGWPECYYDDAQGKLVLAPEYGGNGGKSLGACATKRAPVAEFPEHWAPDALIFYNGTQFPAHYSGGAFIAFHGSWNRAPLPPGGLNVPFLPPANGQTSATYEIFADGFAGAVKQPGQAAHRPTGLAVGPDGVFFITRRPPGSTLRPSATGSRTNGAHSPAHPPGAPATAFRGSWNRAPFPQGGYNVVFVPFANG